VKDGKDTFQFGKLATFNFADPSRNFSSGKEFEQNYGGGKGVPGCPTSSSTVNVYCSNNMDCLAVPGSGSSACISPVSSMEKYCVCSIRWMGSGMCDSLVVNIISTECPTGVPIPNRRPSESKAAIAFGIIFALICCAWIGTTIWRVSEGKRGCKALPFSDYFTNEQPPQVYTARGHYETL